MRNDSEAAARGRKFFQRVIVPIIEFICAMGSLSVAFLGGVGKAHAFVLGVGVSPASNLTTNLPQSVVTSFDKVFIENLKAKYAVG